VARLLCRCLQEVGLHGTIQYRRRCSQPLIERTWHHCATARRQVGNWWEGKSSVGSHFPIYPYWPRGMRAASQWGGGEGCKIDRHLFVAHESQHCAPKATNGCYLHPTRFPNLTQISEEDPKLDQIPEADDLQNLITFLSIDTYLVQFLPRSDHQFLDEAANRWRDKQTKAGYYTTSLAEEKAWGK